MTNKYTIKIIKESNKSLLKENTKILNVFKSALAKAGGRFGKLTTVADVKGFLSGPEFRDFIIRALDEDATFKQAIKNLGKSTDVTDIGRMLGDVSNNPKAKELLLKQFDKLLQEQAPALYRRLSQRAANDAATGGNAAQIFAKNLEEMFLTPEVIKNVRKGYESAGERVLKQGADDVVQPNLVQKISQRIANATDLEKKATATLTVAGLAAAAASGDSPTPEIQAGVAENPKAALKALDDPQVKVKPKDKNKAANTIKNVARTHKQRRVALAAKTIGKGPKDAVINIQSRLQTLGYDLGKFGVDGDYGGATVRAVRDFQRQNGLKVDGMIGPNTWKVLSSDKAKAKGAKGGGKGEDTAQKSGLDKQIFDLKDNPARAVRVYTYIQNQLRRETSSIQTFEVMPRIQTTQGGYVVKNTGYSTDSPNLGPVLMGFLQALVNEKNNAAEVLKMTPEKLMQIIKMGLALPGNQKQDDDEGSTIDVDALTKDKGGPSLFAKDVTGRSNFELQENKKYDLEFNKWSKLWK